MDCQGNSGFCLFKEFFDLSCIFIWVQFAGTFVGAKFRVCSFSWSFVEMYCPIVTISPLVGRVPGNFLVLVFSCSSVEIEIGNLVKIRD